MPSRGKERDQDDGHGEERRKPKSNQERVPKPTFQGKDKGKIAGSTPGAVASKASKSTRGLTTRSDEARSTAPSKRHEESKATSSKTTLPPGPARTTDRQTGSHSKRVNQQMANLTMTSEKNADPRDKRKEEAPSNYMPNKGHIPQGEELKNLVKGFIALSIALDLGRLAIVKACKIDPQRNPYSSSKEPERKSDSKTSGTKEPVPKASSLKKPEKMVDHPQLPLWIKIEQLKPEFEYWEKEVISIFGESEYRALHTSLQENSSPKWPEDVIHWFKTKESIENFFQQANQQAGNIIYAMKGHPTEAAKPPRSEPLGDIPIDKDQSPLALWSTLWWNWLFGCLTQVPCFPKPSRERLVYLWLDLMDEKFQEFCQAKASISAGITYVRQSYTSYWKGRHVDQHQGKLLFACDNLLDDLEKHRDLWYEGIMKLENHEGWRNRLKSSHVSSHNVELATTHGSARFNLRLEDDLVAFEEKVRRFADCARGVLLSKRSLVHNAHDGYEAQLLEWKKATMFQETFPQRKRVAANTPLVSSGEPTRAYGTWD